MIHNKYRNSVTFGSRSIEVCGNNGVFCRFELVTLFLMFGQIGCAAKPAKTNDSSVDNAVREETVDSESLEVKDLTFVSVDDLASRNSAPRKTDVRRKLAVSKDFAWTEQRRVMDVWEKLLARSDDCFADIIAHMDDDRYSITYSRLGVFNISSVGDICLSLAAQRLETLILDDDPRIIAFQWIRSAKDERRLWILKHARTSLVELQLEGLDEMEKNFTSMAQFGSIKDHYLRRIEAARRRIKSTKKPIPFEGDAFHTQEDCYDAIEFLRERDVIIQDEGARAVEGRSGDTSR